MAKLNSTTISRRTVERLEAELARWEAGLGEPLWPSHRSTLDTLDGQTIQLYF